MVTDHLLIRRAAAELDRTLRGSRVRDVGLTDEGRFALVATARGAGGCLAAAPFASPPLLWLEPGSELALAAEPSWTRAIGAVLRGLTVTAVRVRRGDRVVALDFGARSRFGVETASRLVMELVPRFGNVVLLKGETVVAAAKTFSPAENPARSIEIGGTYQPPPLPPARLTREAFRQRLHEGAGAWMKALAGYLPFVPRAVAESFVLEAGETGLRGSALADWFEQRATELEALSAGRAALYVYRRDGVLVQAHLVPLLQHRGLDESKSAELLPLFAEAARGTQTHRRNDALDALRTRLERAVRRRLAAVDQQATLIRERRADVDGRDQLRRAGDAIYAHLAEIPPGATAFTSSNEPGLEIELDPKLDAKANAAQLFARYRKASDALPHLERRDRALARERSNLETSLWEIERADREALEEIAADSAGSRAPRRPRRIRAIELPSGARVYVGRSPRDNVEITFSIARPDDLWFHARNTPGAHVVLVAAPGTQASDDDIAHAASLAALHSRGKSSGKVEVDYTRRKFVRKQRDGAPGMVWYTDFKTILAAPH